MSSKRRIAYGVSKAGVERMTFGLAEDVKGYNLAVNSLAPVGITETAIARELFPGKDPESWVRPEDVAKAARWLACQSAETFTGNAVAVARGATTLVIYGVGTSERKFVCMDQEERFSNLLDCYPKAWLSGRLLETKKMGLHEMFGPVANADRSLSAGKTCLAEEAFEYKRTPGIF